MPESDETSPSGQPIHRHAARQKPFNPAYGDADKIRQIEAHIEAHLGKPETVFHEIVSDLVHIDVHFIRATPKRNFHTLVTTGMSDLPMKVPAGAEERRYAELMISLPPQWPIEQEAFKDERNYWPVRWLKTIARFPHEYDTWIGPGHTIPTGDPPRPYAANTRFCCMMVVPSLMSPKAFWKLDLPDRVVNFYALWPIYREEMEYKLQHAMTGLLDKLEESPATNPRAVEVVDVDRPNACAKKGWFGRR
ncbi:MAG TPA: suppressor of fused domain protein [Tepidisphaeraceae bacterium]|jgi:hypothetical protein|nr:suppressor of fused domain protein [Tepidisphaeraceae bacterium]